MNGPELRAELRRVRREVERHEERIAAAEERLAALMAEPEPARFDRTKHDREDLHDLIASLRLEVADLRDRESALTGMLPSHEAVAAAREELAEYVDRLAVQQRSLEQAVDALSAVIQEIEGPCRHVIETRSAVLDAARRARDLVDEHDLDGTGVPPAGWTPGRGDGRLQLALALSRLLDVTARGALGVPVEIASALTSLRRMSKAA